MYWKIPPIPDKIKLNKPKYKIIFTFFITIIAAIYTYGLTLATDQKIRLFLFSFPTIAVLFFMYVGFLYIRYQHSVVTYDNWENEKTTTKKEWQTWCQSSITSLANVIYTPDKEGAQVFLMDTETIPMFPDKPRRLYNNLQIDENLLSKIDKQLEIQCPNYRVYLSKIYLFNSSNSSNIENEVFNRWNIKPVIKSTYKDIFSVYDNSLQETFLIITISSNEKYSEFISAQLFSTEKNIVNSNIDQINIERVMKIDNQHIDEEIIKYIDYSGISKNKKFKTWISKTQQDVIENIIITYSDKNIEYDKNQPIYSLAISYSLPHPDAFLTYLSLLTEISVKTKTDQVLLHFNPDNSGYAVYISNRS